ncbi:MAG: hypothetical protein FD189_2325 [Elusimicrobia bacterium]|nr:MAG: hypothetical protein FD154_2319 [Elusimicrobiota bacterium]KAF0153706.1 MAG: hypothetical protein FD189_2325 [Elusimicrobiota bacterium]
MWNKFSIFGPGDTMPEQGGIARSRCRELCDRPEQGGIARSRCRELCDRPQGVPLTLYN